LLAIGIHGGEDNFTVTILTTSAGLSCILAVHGNFLGEGLLVSNLGSTYVCLYVEFAKQTVYDNLQMQLAHTGNNGLAGFAVRVNTEGGILFSKLCQRNTHLILTSFGLGLDGDVNNRLGELHGLQDYRMLLIADGVTGSGDLKSYCSS